MVNELVDQFGKALRRPSKAPYTDIECPSCKSPIGVGCRSTLGTPRAAHAARKRAARALEQIHREGLCERLKDDKSRN